jgi:uncharacterized protein
MTFWESSALLTVLAAQPGSDLLLQLIEDDPDLVLWWATPVELTSGLCRLRREAALDENAFSGLLARVDTYARKSQEIEPTDQVRRVATRLLRAYGLRAANALQLAAALVWMDHDPNGARFICVDKRLRDAAEREGFSVLPRGA